MINVNCRVPGCFSNPNRSLGDSHESSAKNATSGSAHEELVRNTYQSSPSSVLHMELQSGARTCSLIKVGA